jgi:secreted trypsin-like serine protease
VVIHASHLLRRALTLACSLLAGVLAGFFVCFPALALGGRAASADSSLKPHLVIVEAAAVRGFGTCTGTVIAPDIILTAAHCVAQAKQVIIAYEEHGSHVVQRVAAKAVNPGYSRASAVSIDIALLRLETRLPARFEPVQLEADGHPHAIGDRRTVAGFGLVGDREDGSSGTLRSAPASILPRIYPRFMRIGYRVDAGLADFAVCTGDSGGPVLDGAVVVGVVYGREKFGDARSCGTTAQAVRIAPQRGWIDSVLVRWGSRGRVATAN